MPVVEITLVEGRSKEKKLALMKAVTEAVVASIEAKPESVRVILREIPSDHFGVAGVPLKKPSP
jgi:4-oxalocrotonate tautomerase